MNTMPNKTVLFDDLISDSRENGAPIVAANAEMMDAAIYSMMDHERFSVVNCRPRTVMTTLGAKERLKWRAIVSAESIDKHVKVYCDDAEKDSKQNQSAEQLCL